MKEPGTEAGFSLTALEAVEKITAGPLRAEVKRAFVRPFSQLLDHGDEYARREAIAALGRLGTRRGRQPPL